MSDNARPALYGADYSVRIANRALGCRSGARARRRQALRERRHRRRRRLPARRRAPGDLLAVPATGAYCWSLSSNYNYLGRPPVVAVATAIARVHRRAARPRPICSAATPGSRRQVPTTAPSEGQRTMIEYRNLRVALLGGGSVGAQVARLLLEQRDELANRVGRRLELIGIAVRDVDAERDRRPAARTLHDRRRIPHPRRRRRRSSSWAASSRPAATSCRRSTRAPMSSPPTRRCSPPTAPSCSKRPSRSARSSTTRPPSPAPSRSSARCATASPATASTASSASSTARRTSSSTGWTPRATPSRTPSPPRPALGYAEADPTADIGGYDAAQKAAILAEPRLPHHGSARRRLPRGHHRRHRRSRSTSARKAGYVIKLLAICERLTDPTTGDEGVSARVYPAYRAAQPSARRRARRQQRRLRRGRSGRQPHVLRRRRRGSGDGLRRARRPRLARPPPRRSAAPASPSPRHADLPVLDIGQCHNPLRRSPSRSTDEPGVLATIAARLQRRTASRSRPSSSRSARRRPDEQSGGSPARLPW